MRELNRALSSIVPKAIGPGARRQGRPLQSKLGQNIDWVGDDENMRLLAQAGILIESIIETNSSTFRLIKSRRDSSGFRRKPAVIKKGRCRRAGLIARRRCVGHRPARCRAASPAPRLRPFRDWRQVFESPRPVPRIAAQTPRTIQLLPPPPMMLTFIKSAFHLRHDLAGDGRNQGLPLPRRERRFPALWARRRQVAPGRHSSLLQSSHSLQADARIRDAEGLLDLEQVLQVGRRKSFQSPAKLRCHDDGAAIASMISILK